MEMNYKCHCGKITSGQFNRFTGIHKPDDTENWIKYGEKYFCSERCTDNYKKNEKESKTEI